MEMVVTLSEERKEVKFAAVIKSDCGQVTDVHHVNNNNNNNNNNNKKLQKETSHRASV